MLYVNSDGSIRLTRGDTARFQVSVQNDLTGDEYAIQEGDILVLTVKKTVNDEDYLIRKKITGGTNFHISPSDTSEMSFGSYVYDVELTTADGDVYTIIGPATFEVLSEVSY